MNAELYSLHGFARTQLRVSQAYALLLPLHTSCLKHSELQYSDPCHSNLPAQRLISGMSSGETERLLESHGRRDALIAENNAVIPPEVDRRLSWVFPPRFAFALASVALVSVALFDVWSVPTGHKGVDAGRGSEPETLRNDASNVFGHEMSSTGGSGSSAGETPAPPNVIFVMIDDAGMNDIGRDSNDLSAVTPFLETLGVNGVRITRYYTNHICTPARSSLMSGRDTFRTGMQYEEIQNQNPWGLPLDEATIADRFKAAGYSTHMAGKWNLGMYEEEYYPHNRGFDTFLGYMGAQETYYSHAWSGYNDFGYGDVNGYINDTSNTTRWGPEMEGFYSTSLTADRALQVATDHVNSGADAPLFMYLAFQAMHFPLQTPVEALFTQEQLDVLSTIKTESPKRMKFAKMMYFLDSTLSRMLIEMDSLGLMDNTLVVVTSDNGGCPAYGGNNYPYRGFKHTLFEGGVRTPAIVYSKSESIIPLEARGRDYDGMMHVTDWTSTLANVTGIPTTEMGKPLSGLDHWAAIIGERPESDPPVRTELVLGRNSYVYDTDSETVVDVGFARGAYINNGWKINIGDKCAGWYSFDRPEVMVVDPQCDTAVCPTCTNACTYVDSNTTFLFNLNDDPYEEVNLAYEMPDKFLELVEQWDAACVDEVVSRFRPSDTAAFAQWAAYNDWVVAWR